MTQNCSKCEKAFISKSDLEKHMLSHDSQNVKRKRGRPGSAVPCGDCEEVFYRRCDLRIHRRLMHHPKKNSCSICGRTFSCEKRLRMHSQFHNNGGEYECFYCMKEFNKGWKLKIHLVNHSGRAPYICQFCQEDYMYPGKFLEHLKRYHGIMYACKDCGEAFEPCDIQEDHICKLYGCKDCRSSFMTIEELASHAVRHKDGTLPVEPVLSTNTTDFNSLPSNELTSLSPSPGHEILPVCSQSENGSNSSCPSSLRVNVTSFQQPMVMVSSSLENSALEVNVSSNLPSVKVDVSCVQPTPDALPEKERNFDSSEVKNSDEKFKSVPLKFGISKWNSDAPELFVEQNLPNWKPHNVENENRTNVCTKLAPTPNPLVHEATVCTRPPLSVHCSGIKSNGGFSFKVPLTDWGPPKRPDTLVKNDLTNTEKHHNKLGILDTVPKLNSEEGISLRILSNNIDSNKRITRISDVTKVVMDGDSRNLISEEQLSLKTWLIGDTSPLIKRDFVFGLKSKDSDNIISSTYNTSKFSHNKSGFDMTFEDLCQF